MTNHRSPGLERRLDLAGLGSWIVFFFFSAADGSALVILGRRIIFPLSSGPHRRHGGALQQNVDKQRFFSVDSSDRSHAAAPAYTVSSSSQAAKDREISVNWLYLRGSPTRQARQDTPTSLECRHAAAVPTRLPSAHRRIICRSKHLLK